MATSPPLTLQKPVRELLRKRGEPMSQEIKLQDREDNLVRMSLMKAAHEQYDEIPERVMQWYDPVQNIVIIDLPDPDDDDDGEEGQLDLSSFEGGESPTAKQRQVADRGDQEQE